MKKKDLIRENGIIGWPMVDTAAKFALPASFGDEVQIETLVSRVGRSSFGIEHRLIKDGQVCIEATEVRVWAALRQDGKPGIEGVPIPKSIAAKLRGD